MPAYTTIEYGFLKQNLSAQFVRDLYSAFHCYGVGFDKVSYDVDWVGAGVGSKYQMPFHIASYPHYSIAQL